MNRIHALTPGEYCFFCLSPDIQKIASKRKTVYLCNSCGKRDGKVLKIDPKIKTSWIRGAFQHYTVGALLLDERKKKYLLMKKRTYPLVIDVIAGHIDSNETPAKAIEREVTEETGYRIKTKEKIWEGLIRNDYCRRGAPNHYWYLYLCTFKGRQKIDKEEVSYLRHYTVEQLKREKKINPAVKKMVAGLDLSVR